MTNSGTITVAQAAKILGKSRWTVIRLINKGHLLADKLDGETTPWLLNRADVERFATRNPVDQDGDAA